MARREYSGGVLVVEDEPLIAMHVAAMLTELGFIDIRFAHSVANGLALMSWTLALGILDVNLGGRLVFPLAEALRAKQIPLVFYLSSSLPANGHGCCRCNGLTTPCCRSQWNRRRWHPQSRHLACSSPPHWRFERGG
jgi:CheY-like chemotaxis protein